MDINKAKTLAEIILKEYGLDEWRVEIDNAKRRFGCCKYRKKIISISEPITELNSEEHVKDTILHEVAHALVGAGYGHGRFWQIKAIAIGCNGRRGCGAEVIAPPLPYKGTCPNCGRSITRHKRVGGACATCCREYNHGRYTAEFKWVWTKNS